MAIKLQSKTFENHRGLNDLSTIKRIEDGSLTDIINFNYVPVAEGRVHVEMREGTSKDTMTTNLTGTATQVQGIFSADFTGGNEVIFAYGDRLLQLASTPTLLQSGVTDSMFNFELYRDKLIIANVSDNLKEKSGGSNTISDVAGSPPKFAYLHSWHNFLFGAGISANKNRLQGSDLADRATWPSGNIHDRPYGEITGIHSLRDTFFIFYENHIEALTGFASDFSNFQFSLFAHIGCISHYGIVSNGDSLFFPTRDGIYAIGGIASTDKIVGGVGLIKLDIKKIKTFWDTLDISTLGLIHGVHDAEFKRIRWSVRRSGVSVNDRELTFDYRGDVLGYAKTEGRSISSYTLGKNSTTGVWEVKYGDSRTDSNGGIIYKLSSSATDDDGTAIVGTLITKNYDFDAPDQDKRFMSVDILAKGNTSSVDTDMSYGVGNFPDFSNTKRFTTDNLITYDTALQYDDGHTYAEDVFTNYRIGIRRRGKSLALKFVSETKGELIRIAGWTINYQKSTLKKAGTDV